MWQDNLEFTHPFLFMKDIEDNYAQPYLVPIHEALTLINNTKNIWATINVAQTLVDQQVDADILLSFLLAPLFWEDSLSEIAVRKMFGENISDVLGHFTAAAITKDGALKLLSQSAEQTNNTILSLAFLLLDLEIDIANNKTPNTKKAEIVLQFFVPIASRLNLKNLRRHLEDAAFHVLDPVAFKKVQKKVTPTSAEDQHCLTLLKKTLIHLLNKYGIEGEIQGRVKSLYSLHCKVCRTGRDIETIMDRIGLRVIVKSVVECYKILGILHSHFQPIPSCFKDYIGLPKNNGYQSLHTCVYPVRSISYKPIEFQIRTQYMDHEAEYGAASHWQYKWKKRSVLTNDLQTAQVPEESPSGAADSKEINTFFHLLQRQVYEDTMVVFGRQGQIIRLHENATVKQYLQRANIVLSPKDIILVNGYPVQIHHVLNDCDSIEIIHYTGAPQEGAGFFNDFHEFNFVCSFSDPQLSETTKTTVPGEKLI